MDDRRRSRAAKRVIVLTLALVLVLALSLFLVLGRKEPTGIPEKYVIEATHDYLVSEAEQLQGSDAFLKKSEINWAFRSAVMNASREAIHSREGLGKSVEVYLDPGDTWLEATHYRTPSWSNALQVLAQDQGNGLWRLVIGDWLFVFNERENEVRAGNNEAANLLEGITLRTYHNTEHGYSIDYPPKWTVLDAIQEAVSISYVSSDGTMERAVFVFLFPRVQGLTLTDYAEERVNSFHNDSYQMRVAESNPAAGGIVADVTGLRFDYLQILGNYIAYEAKWYFIEKDEKICEVLTVARPTPPGVRSHLFDPYTSLRFLP